MQNRWDLSKLDLDNKETTEFERQKAIHQTEMNHLKGILSKDYKNNSNRKGVKRKNLAIKAGVISMVIVASILLILQAI